jgi:CheY-like chemotaxis protein
MNTTNQNNQQDKPLIMVVDDNPEFLDGIELILQMEGFEVWTALSGQKALDELLNVFQAKIQNSETDRHLPDLILADIMMPEMDGYEVAKQIRERGLAQELPIIFITAETGPKPLEKFMAAGAVGSLQKPVDPDVLKRKVSLFLNIYKRRMKRRG